MAMPSLATLPVWPTASAPKPYAAIEPPHSRSAQTAATAVGWRSLNAWIGMDHPPFEDRIQHRKRFGARKANRRRYRNAPRDRRRAAVGSARFARYERRLRRYG